MEAAPLEFRKASGERQPSDDVDEEMNFF